MRYTFPVYRAGTEEEVDQIEVEAENTSNAQSLAQMTLLISDHDWHDVSMGSLTEGDTSTL